MFDDIIIPPRDGMELEPECEGSDIIKYSCLSSTAEEKYSLI